MRSAVWPFWRRRLRLSGGVSYSVRMRLVLAALAVAALSRSVGAADYWVGNGGNDGADGLTTATAWATLGHAADVINPGDTVHVEDGSYQGFYLSRSGTAGNPIVFRAGERTRRSPPTTARRPTASTSKGQPTSSSTGSS